MENDTTIVDEQVQRVGGIHTMEEYEEYVEETGNWPQYYVNGPELAESDGMSVPCYYKVEGANGPVYTMREGQDKPHPSTMYDFAMECIAYGTEDRFLEHTPFLHYELSIRPEEAIHTLECPECGSTLQFPKDIEDVVLCQDCDEFSPMEAVAP